MARPSKREQLMDAAERLFCEYGYHATGIDRILAEAGTAKMTLYNHFPSKDELILAVLRRRSERQRDWLLGDIAGRADDPRGQLLAVFDALDDWFHNPDFHGCAFVNAAAEFGAAEDAVHQAAAEHKHMMGALLRDLAERAGANEPARLAEDLMLLIEGAISLAHVAGRKSAARRAKRAAALLIDAAARPRAA